MKNVFNMTGIPVN